MSHFQIKEMYHLSQINIYPVKSLGCISLRTAYAGEKGLQYDRRWMLVDEANKFITQREHPIMATIGVEINENGFSLFQKSKKHEAYHLPFAIDNGVKNRVTVWDDQCDVLTLDSEINVWISELLNQVCKFVYMPDDSRRYVDNIYAPGNETVSFADGYPILIIGEASLSDLNERLETPVPMNRFRPNFVFTGGVAFEEDSWNNFRIGDAVFNAVKPCGRCVITTIDQESGNQSKEPLRTLSQYRKTNNNVYFGQNLLVVKPGKVTINDTLVFIS